MIRIYVRLQKEVNYNNINDVFGSIMTYSEEYPYRFFTRLFDAALNRGITDQFLNNIENIIKDEMERVK